MKARLRRLPASVSTALFVLAAAGGSGLISLVIAAAEAGGDDGDPVEGAVVGAGLVALGVVLMRAAEPDDSWPTTARRMFGVPFLLAFLLVVRLAWIGALLGAIFLAMSISDGRGNLVLQWGAIVATSCALLAVARWTTLADRAVDQVFDPDGELAAIEGKAD